MVSNRKIVYSIVALFILSNLFFIKISYAKNLSLNNLLNQIQLRQRNIQTLICNIKQIKTSKLFTRPIIFIGKLYYKRPNLIRYEFKKPIYSAIIINNNYILKCTDDMQPLKIKKDMFTNKFKDLKLIFNITTLNYLKKSFNIKIIQSNSTITIDIKPKEKNKINKIKYIKLILNRDGLVPHKLIILDSQNNLTKIILTNIEINCSIPKEIFYKCH